MFESKVLYLSCAQQSHWRICWQLNCFSQAPFNNARTRKRKVSCTYINTPYLTSLFVVSSVFACSTLKSLVKLLYVSILILGAFPLADRNTSHLFSGPALKATSFIEKCLFHFHTDLPRGGSDICRKQSQTMYSVPPPFHDPLRSKPDPPPPFIQQRHMSWWILSITGFGSVFRAMLFPRSSVMIKCPLQLEMPQIKG